MVKRSRFVSKILVQHTIRLYRRIGTLKRSIAALEEENQRLLEIVDMHSLSPEDFDNAD